MRKRKKKPIKASPVNIGDEVSIANKKKSFDGTNNIG
jgi:hypothetical protein